jgi:dipeptidyl aminopeptidase/acylaminoacyl peptidase
MKKFISLTLVFFFLFGCGSSTLINSNPSGAKLYLDGQPIGGFIYKPEKPNQKGIIYCHGGFINIQIDMEFPDVLNYCNNGFTVLVLKFEDESGNPPDPNRDRIEVKDAATVLRKIVPSLTDICLVGVSRGGYVALETFAYFPNDFKKCVAMIAPTDMENYDWTVWVQMHSNKEAFIKATQKYFAQTPSPMRLAEAGKYDGSKMLLLYGGKDPICPPQQHCIPLAQKAGCKFIVFPDASHNVHRLTEAQVAAMRFMQE